jgi:hypothetical protein
MPDFPAHPPAIYRGVLNICHLAVKTMKGDAKSAKIICQRMQMACRRLGAMHNGGPIGG